jgi:hypothetical protein
MRRAKIRGGDREAAVTLTRVAVQDEHLVYIIASNKRVPYGRNRSRIVYIGTTSKGVDRILRSVADKARQALAGHGTRRIEVHVYAVAGRPRVKMWLKLEQGLLLAFKDVYACVPKYNKKGMSMRWEDQGDYLAKAGLKHIIRRYEA